MLVRKLQFVVVIVFLIAIIITAFQPRYAVTHRMDLFAIESQYSQSEVKSFSTKQFIRKIADAYSFDTKHLFENVDLVRGKPTINKFIIANPKGFLDNDKISRNYIDGEFDVNGDMNFYEFAKKLPVIYIADIHSEYGTLGFMLNVPSTKTVGDLYSSLKSLRNKRIYNGGVQKKGSSFTMLHKRAGFPDNRAFKVLPGNTDFKLYFSPDVAMANELILTGDAKPSEFKFFEWTTIWSPKQLDLEYDDRLWLTINGTSQIIFDDSEVNIPLWVRIIKSLPQSYFD